MVHCLPSDPIADPLKSRQTNNDNPLTSDPNHKPEMAIALTPFKAFLNFLPLPSLLLNLLSTPELDTLIPFSLTSKLATSLTLPNTRPPTSLLFSPTQAAPTDDQKAILKDIFGALMNAKEDDVKAVIKQLLERWQGGDVKENEEDLVELVKTLNEQYPEDVGVLCVFILNVVELKKGEAAFLGADMPHAYISGGELGYQSLALSHDVEMGRKMCQGRVMLRP